MFATRLANLIPSLLIGSLYSKCTVMTVKSVVVHFFAVLLLESSWNVMANGDAREGKWRGNWRMKWVASTLHTTSEHCVSSITTADAYTSAASTRLNCRPRRFKWTRPFRRKNEIWCLCVCHHFSNAVYLLFVKSWYSSCTLYPHTTHIKQQFIL